MVLIMQGSHDYQHKYPEVTLIGLDIWTPLSNLSKHYIANKINVNRQSSSNAKPNQLYNRIVR